LERGRRGRRASHERDIIKEAKDMLSNRLSRLLTDTLGEFDWQLRDSAAASWVPPVDIVEEADAIRIVTELPGVKPENVKISLENNVLTIQGTKEQVAEERAERVHRYERT